jgi:integrase
MPHVTVFDKSARQDGTFSRDDFTYDHDGDVYYCPGGKILTTTGSRINDGATLRYRASKYDCEACRLKPRCCPKEPARYVPRSIYEGARDMARQIARSWEGRIARRLRKKVEMLFAHLKRILKLDRLRLRRDVIKEDGKWSIVIPPEETKTRTYIDFQIPEDLQHQFLTYLTHVRPRMLRRPGCKALWVSAKGGPLSYSAVGPVLTRNTTKRLGIRIAPHDARDAAATTWAIAAPEQIGVARDLLAHSDLRTTIKHYNRARRVEASRAHNQLIARLRRKPGRGDP